MLCSVCANFGSDLPPLYSYNVAILKEASQSRPPLCDMCVLFWDCLRELLGDETPRLYDRLEFKGETAHNQHKIGPMRGVLIPHNPATVRVIRLQFYIKAGDGHLPWTRFGYASPVSESGISDTSVALALSWMSACDGSHSTCAATNESPSLPTRLIYLGEDNSDLRIHVTVPGGPFLRYAALSHCWGGSTPLTTTTSNLEEHKENLPYEKLPLTFTNATAIVRKLGIEYLWIDSLCILQGRDVASLADWAVEAPRMANVYGNAYITISADAAQNSQTGFLANPARVVGRSAAAGFGFNDNQGKHYHGILQIREEGTQMRQLPIHGWGPSMIMPEQPLKNQYPEGQVPDYLAPQHEAPSTKLSTRGWVLQERLLSRRTLHFGQSEMGWECHTSTKCECLVYLDCECSPSWVGSPPGATELKETLGNRDWKQIVTEYTRMELTVKGDRLPAISSLAMVFPRQTQDVHKTGLWKSVARAFPRQTQDAYRAGLWKLTLVHELMWYSSSDKAISGDRRFSEYYAPTWSWASLIAPVQYRSLGPSASAVSSFKVLDSVCELATDNAFGAVKKGSFLQVRGPVLQVRIEKATSGQQILVPRQIKNSQLAQIQVILDDEDDLGLNDEQRLLFLIIREHKTGLDGLVLKQALLKTKSGEEGYERCGYAYVGRSYFEPYLEGSNEDTSPFSLDRYVGSPGTGWSLWSSVSAVKKLTIF